MEIALIVGAAVLLFGADKLPKLARSLGNAKKEFAVGQVEADVAAEKARQEMMAKVEAEKKEADKAAGAAAATGEQKPA
jgi:sec-independent protein translocase protein TatA